MTIDVVALYPKKKHHTGKFILLAILIIFVNMCFIHADQKTLQPITVMIYTVDEIAGIVTLPHSFLLNNFNSIIIIIFQTLFDA